MSPFLRALKLTWDHFSGGDQDTFLPDLGHPPVDERLMSLLAEMYQSHGVEVRRVANWVLAEGGALITRAACVGQQEHPGTFMVQVDFATVVDLDKHIIESFVGMGPDKDLALLDASKAFLDASFHVLLSALLGRSCGHCVVESWTMGHLQRQVSLGSLRIRGQFPANDWPRLFEKIQQQLESHELSPGLHWIRVFYSHSPTAQSTAEVLVDNDVEEALQAAVGRLDWPQTADFYSVRLFMVIQDAEDASSAG
ncbi:MAG: DUF6348 family protein [Prosthecobacter sp.]